MFERIAKAIRIIFISVLPGLVGSAWYSINKDERRQSLKTMLSMAESMQNNSSL